MTITLALDAVQAEYLLERLGGPPMIDSTSSDQEHRDAVSYDCIVGQLERGLGIYEMRDGSKYTVTHLPPARRRKGSSDER